METLRSKINTSRFTTRQPPPRTLTDKSKISDLKIGFDDTPYEYIHTKRKRDRSINDIERILTNDPVALFETTLEKNFKNENKNKEFYNLRTKHPDDTSDKITQIVTRRFEETTKHSENYKKELTALKDVRSKIKTLIEVDENTVDLANRLKTETYNNSNVEYVCDPQLSQINSQQMPKEASRLIDDHLGSENLKAGIIPEIDTAYV